MNGRRIIEILNGSPESNVNGSGEMTCPYVSVEYFPPRTEEGLITLKKNICRMKAIPPTFVDFTWGAGGSTSTLTLKLSSEAQQLGLEVNMHITCTNMDPNLVKQALETAKAAGIRNITALRGDPVNMCGKWGVCKDGYVNALSLVKYIRKEYGDYFGICVAGYPEGHPDKIKAVPGGFDSLSDTEKARCRISTVPDGEDIVEVCSDEDYSIELSYLKQKVDAGADFIMTQMFFDVAQYENFVKACRAIGINVPIIPGIMCITNYQSLKKMVDFCKVRVPEDLMARMKSIQDDRPAVTELAVEFSSNLCRELMRQRVPGLHLFTLNSTKVPIRILEELGLEGKYHTQNTPESSPLKAHSLEHSKE